MIKFWQGNKETTNIQSPLDYFKLSAGFPIETIGYRPLNMDYRGKTAEAYAYVSARGGQRTLDPYSRPEWTVELDRLRWSAVYQLRPNHQVKGVTMCGWLVRFCGQKPKMLNAVAILGNQRRAIRIQRASPAHD